MNVYEYGARTYDPSYVRFWQIDPMADFVIYQSPYVYADNNPVLYQDDYGLGILNVLGNLFKRAAHAVKTGISKLVNNDCRCHTFSGESLRDAWIRSDFGRSNSTTSNYNNKPKPSSNNDSSGSDLGSEPSSRESISRVDIFLPNIDNNISIPQISSISPMVFNNNNNQVQRPRTPSIGGRPIPIGTTMNYNANVNFIASSNKFRDIAHTERSLMAILKTLTDFPQLTVLILGNFATGSGVEGVNGQTPARVNGTDGTVGGLQLSRARAIERFLIQRGINPNRITVGHGQISDETMSASMILRNP